MIKCLYKFTISFIRNDSNLSGIIIIIIITWSLLLFVSIDQRWNIKIEKVFSFFMLKSFSYRQAKVRNVFISSFQLILCCFLSVFKMFWHVSLHMKSEVVRSGETSLADFAFERLGARVLSIVSSQLIRPENDQDWHGASWVSAAAQFLQKNVGNLTGDCWWLHKNIKRKNSGLAFVLWRINH